MTAQCRGAVRAAVRRQKREDAARWPWANRLAAPFLAEAAKRAEVRRLLAQEAAAIRLAMIRAWGGRKAA